LLTGGDLLAMGYEPGPLLGEILDALEEAQLEGSLETRAAAEEFVRSRYEPNRPSTA
jgi:tRNA nucleotidyltransferase/poly(A) polymerase